MSDVANQYAKEAYQRLLDNEDMFTGLCDEITISEIGQIRFKFGAFNYDLTAYNVAKDPLHEVLDAVKRSKPYYDKLNAELDKKK